MTPPDDYRHLMIVGGGSAAFSAAVEAHRLGARVTIVNDGLPIGGTCVNVGCLPSKTMLWAAESLHAPNENPFAGVESLGELASFEDLADQKDELVRRVRRARYEDVIDRLERVRLIGGHGEFTGTGTIDVAGETLAFDRVLVATGATPSIPFECHGDVDVLTSETALELRELPESLVIVGGNFLGLECAQLFSRLGTEVTVLERATLLPEEADDLSEEIEIHLAEEGIAVETGAPVRRVRPVDDGVEVVFESDAEPQIVTAERVLSAAGRVPNTDSIGAEKAGFELEDDGYVAVDDHLQTTVPDIYAAGDVIGAPMFVYTAAYEAKLAARNALAGNESTAVDYAPLPRVMFTDPQFAAVGLDERRARRDGFSPEATSLPVSEIPRAIAERDDRGVIKLIRDRQSDRILGGRIIAPEAGEIVMELSMAIRNEMTVTELADCLHPYLTLSEGIRLAALSFETAVDELSCCAG